MHASARVGCGARLGARARAPARLALAALPSRPRAGGRAAPAPPRAYTVKLTHAGVEHTLSVSGDESILEVALDAGIDVPHDCKMGVCMTCPAKLTSGKVDQSGGSMLSSDVADKGFVLLCCGRPESDCSVMTVDEEELLSQQMHSGAL